MRTMNRLCMAVMAVSCIGVGVIQPIMLERFCWINGVFCFFAVLLALGIVGDLRKAMRKIETEDESSGTVEREK